MILSRLSALLQARQQASHASEQIDDFENAAVLILLHQYQGEDHLLLTKRTETVAHHKGQICFPGGVHDAGDPNLWKTALRETFEELGITPETISYIGALDPMMTPTGFMVFPFLGALTQPLAVHPSPHEIAEVFSVPLSHLLDPKNLKFVRRSLPHLDSTPKLPREFRELLSQGYDDPTFVYRDYEIWGVTGRILMQLVEMLKSFVNLKDI